MAANAQVSQLTDRVQQADYSTQATSQQLQSQSTNLETMAASKVTPSCVSCVRWAKKRAYGGSKRLRESGSEKQYQNQTKEIVISPGETQSFLFHWRRKALYYRATLKTRDSTAGKPGTKGLAFGLKQWFPVLQVWTAPASAAPSQISRKKGVAQALGLNSPPARHVGFVMRSSITLY